VVTRFLDCVLDGGARSLRRGGAQLHLTPKAFEVLLLLVAERPRAMPKTEILDRVWPGTFVTDASLARTIHEIRDAIGDNAATPAIRTVHGHGYAFTAEAADLDEPRRRTASTAVEPQVLAWLLLGAQAIPLTAGEALIGRDPVVAVPLESLQASWHHARIVVTAAQATIEDLGSKNGTQVRGHRVAAAWVLQDGDDIVIGATRLVFRTGEKVGETVTNVSE
jgi:DNA-binding winged helix-turn-helix (wHTH) protein